MSCEHVRWRAQRYSFSELFRFRKMAPKHFAAPFTDFKKYGKLSKPDYKYIASEKKEGYWKSVPNTVFWFESSFFWTRGRVEGGLSGKCHESPVRLSSRLVSHVFSAKTRLAHPQDFCKKPINQALITVSNLSYISLPTYNAAAALYKV